MHSAWPSQSIVARGERIPQALQVKSAAWMQTRTPLPTRPLATTAWANGALQTLHDVRESGAMMPHPGQIRMPCDGPAP